MGIRTRVRIVIQVILTEKDWNTCSKFTSMTTRLIHNSLMLVDIRLNMEDPVIG